MVSIFPHHYPTHTAVRLTHIATQSATAIPKELSSSRAPNCEDAEHVTTPLTQFWSRLSDGLHQHPKQPPKKSCTFVYRKYHPNFSANLSCLGDRCTDKALPARNPLHLRLEWHVNNAAIMK